MRGNRVPVRLRHALLAALAAVLVAPLAVAVAPAASAAPPPVGPFTVDVTNRESVRRAWFDIHEAANGIPIGWTGDAATCNPGTVSPQFLDATLSRINWFRAMAGVPSDTAFTAENNTEAQATALIIGAHKSLGTPQEDAHHPPQSWECWTPLGFNGAGRSNLAIGNTGPPAIDQLVRDSGVLGHRRTILNPQISSMGSGSVPATATTAAAEAQLMVDAPAQPVRPARDGFVAWPAPGWTPYQAVYPRWSFVLRGANFAGASVVMEKGGVAVEAPILSREDFAGPGIVWQANGLDDTQSWPKPASDETWKVTVRNVVVDGTARDITYDVHVFDPAMADPTQTPLTITGPDRPPLGQPSAYAVNAIPNAEGFQWRTTRLTPVQLADGAETGLTNFDADLGGATYSPVSTNFAAGGTSSFRLSIGQGVSSPQTLTLKPTVVPSDQSVLTFNTRANRTTNMLSQVEVSADDGATWKPLYRELATDDTGFTARAVPLGGLAGAHLKVRFRTEIEPPITPDRTFACCGTEGWYVDDVAITNALMADPPVLSPVDPATTFTFTPTTEAQYDLDVRASFHGSGFGEWSKATRVSTQPPAAAPIIAVQPQNVAVADGGTATLSVSATGTPAPTFAWSRNGTELVDGARIAGSHSATLTLTDVRPEQAGAYQVRVVNPLGTVDSAPATLTVTPGLAAALDGAGLRWATEGNSSWAPQAATTHDGTDATRSGAVTDLQSSVLTTRVSGSATVSFWWKVDSEQRFDQLSVTVDGAAPFAPISGNVDWQQQHIVLSAGDHTIRWTYAKDGSVSVGQDAGWVDEVQVGLPPVPLSLGDALDGAGQALASAGDLQWTGQRDVTHDGADAARSGGIGDNQTSTLAAVVDGPATLSFWWKVDSELNFDKLSVTVDGVAAVAPISGNVDWEQKSVPLGPGRHTIVWTYTKDGSVSAGQNAAWLDQVALT